MYIFCSICQDLLTFEKGPVLALLCGHVYHKNCIEKWMRKSRSCPVCKEFIGKEKLQRLFFSFRQDDPEVTKLQNKVNKLNDFIQQNVRDLEIMDLETNRKNLEIEKKDKKLKRLMQKINELSERIEQLEITLNFEEKFQTNKENSVNNFKDRKSRKPTEDHENHDSSSSHSQASEPKTRHEKPQIVKQLFVDTRRKHHSLNSRHRDQVWEE